MKNPRTPQRRLTRRRPSAKTATRIGLALGLLAAAAGTLMPTPASAAPDPTKCAALTTAGNANVKRAYSNTALINTPVTCLDEAADASTWATRWYEYGHKGVVDNPTLWAAYKGDIDVSFRTYSSPIYDGTGLTTRRIFGSKNWYNSDRPTTGANSYEAVPWSASFTAATGNDKELTVVLPATGKEWGLWLPQDPFYWFNGCMFSYPDFHPEWGDLCYAGIRHGTNYAGPGIGDLAAPVSDYRHNSGSDGFSQGQYRGVGAVDAVTMVPTFDEVKYAVDELKLGHLDNGYIHHALNMETYNTMFGAACTPADFGTAAPGNTCGYAVAPATMLENFSGPGNGMANTAANRQKTVPEGTRFYLKLTDTQIQTWLTGRGLTTANQKYWTAYVFARSLREYGWIVSDTTGWTSTISVDSSASAGKVSQWATLGIDVLANPGDTTLETDGATLLEGLVTASNQVGVVKIPDSTRCITDPAYPAAKNKCVNAF